MTIQEFVEWERTSRDCIDVKRCYIDICEDLVAGILLSQIMYWFLPKKNGEWRLKVGIDGVIYLAKNRADWWDECRITTRQYDRAIKILVDKGFVEVHDGLFNKVRTPMITVFIKTVIGAIESLQQKEAGKENNPPNKKQRLSYRKCNRVFKESEKPNNPTLTPIT